MRSSTILIAYNSDQWIDACITSLREASEAPQHLVLVDNGGNSRLDEVDFGDLEVSRLWTDRSLGFALANNFALRNAPYLEDYLVFLNQDTISRTGWIDRCLSAMESDPSLGAVSPFIRTYDGTDWDPSFLDCMGRPDTWEADEVVERPYAPAPALVARRSALLAAGPFDPVFGSYYEDFDLCRRIRDAGYRIGFVRSAEINHFSGSTTDTVEKRRRRMRLILRNRTIHRLRSRPESRGRQLLRHVVKDVPMRLARGLLGREGSQPPLIVLSAQIDLLGLACRLFSAKEDRKAWDLYLNDLGWPHEVPGPRVDERKQGESLLAAGRSASTPDISMGSAK